MSQNITSVDDVALFDMDGTLCDWQGQMMKDLERLKSPDEEIYTNLHGDIPKYVKNRYKLIISAQSWWANLPRFQLGFDVYDIAQELGFNTMILTQAPRNNPAAAAGKLEWIMRELGRNVNFTFTRDKSLVYGKILVDDYPVYINNWLGNRPNGLVIMPASSTNAEYTHPNVIRYDGTNLPQVRVAMEIAKNRKGGEPLNL